MSACYIEFRKVSAEQLIETSYFHDFDWDNYVRHTSQPISLDDHKELIHKTVWDLQVESLEQKLDSYNNNEAEGRGYHSLHLRYTHRVAMTFEDHEWTEDLLEFF